MHNLTAITPLGGTAPRSETIGKATCTEVTGLALASVTARQGSEDICSQHLMALLGAEPPAPGKAHLGQPFSAFWMGPQQWMVSAPIDTHEDIEAHLKARFTSAALVVEQTDAWCCFDLSGTLEPIMELLCPINMRAMKTADALRTSVHHMGCFVLALEAACHLRILGPRASAGSLHHAVVEAMRAV